MKSKKKVPDAPIRIEAVSIDELKPHPENYRIHGTAQLRHIVESLKANGIYKNVVCAKDLTILAGHGVVEGCKELKIKTVPVCRLNIDPHSVAALKIVAGDNEISRLGEVNDRQLADTLKQILTESGELLGTGFDEMALANLVFVTRSESEIKDFDAAMEWVGMPAYQDTNDELKKNDDISLVVVFDTEAQREKFVEDCKLKIAIKRGRKWSTMIPYKERHDPKSVRFENAETA